MPFRRELTDMALAMARTVQVEKGHGVMYLIDKPLLYTAPLAGAADLPDDVGAWALELAGRRKVAGEVTARVAEVRRQQAEQHAKRLRTDHDYRIKHEARRQMSPTIGLMRERLPPWPLGAMRKVDMDFRKACLDENGLLPLMRALPDVAAEVLLASPLKTSRSGSTVQADSRSNLALTTLGMDIQRRFGRALFSHSFRLRPKPRSRRLLHSSISALSDGSLKSRKGVKILCLA